MDFFPFGDSKIKIVLTESEAKEYSLEAPFSGAASAGQRRAVFEILELARANVGFDVSTDKILIQLFYFAFMQDFSLILTMSAKSNVSQLPYQTEQKFLFPKKNIPQ